MGYYAFWYPKLYFPSASNLRLQALAPVLINHARYVEKTSRGLAREIFHQMLKYQKKLEAKQSILNRIVDIGTDLLAMSASCSYADYLSKKESNKTNAVQLADLFCRDAKKRIETNFKDQQCNTDRLNIRIAKKLMAKEFEWLENEIMK